MWLEEMRFKIETAATAIRGLADRLGVGAAMSWAKDGNDN
jgi:hypothetical protein